MNDGVIRIGAMLSGGDSASWCKDLFNTEFAFLDGKLQAVDDAPSNTLFLPYLKGERCPFNDSAVRGAFLMLERTSTPEQLFYAVLEGIAFSIRANLEAVGNRVGPLRLIGGGALSALLPQLIADACGAEVIIADAPTAITAFGAFVLAAETLGLRVDRGEGKRRAIPRPARAARTHGRYAAFIEATAFARRLATHSLG
jgi:xylulokinase